MTTLKALLLILLAAFVGLPLAAQGTDCSFTRTFTGNLTAVSSPNLSNNTPCVNWRVTVSTTGTLSATVEFQTSPDNVTFTAVPATICSSSVQPPCVLAGTQPIVGTQGMMLVAAYGSYVRVVITSSSGTGTGTIRGYGAKGATASSLPSSGSGGGSGTVTSVGFTGGLISVANPTTAPAFTVAGTSGGIPYFSSASTWASSGALTQYFAILGGGAGNPPTSSVIKDDGTAVTITQNSVAPFTSVASGAVANTLNLNGGRVGLGTASVNTRYSVGLIPLPAATIAMGITVNPFTDFAAGFEFGENPGLTGYVGGLYWSNIYGSTNGVKLTSSGFSAPINLLSSDRIIISGGGKVGIGTMTPIYALDVSGGVGASGTVRFFDQTASTGSTLVTVTPGAAQTAASTVLALGGSQTIAGTLLTTGITGASAFKSTGTTYTLSTNTCSGTSLVGGATAGTFVSGTTGTCTVIITMGSSATAPTGWACTADDRTTPADLIGQTASSATTATLSGTTLTSDVISFSCIGY